jgi:hypothetical protein
MPDSGELLCMRAQGHSAAICHCRLGDGGGWLPCPDTLRGMLTSTYPPMAYQKQSNQAKDNKARAAMAAGYTGNICDICGSPRMRRAGTCETCDDCGSAGGCG